MVAKTRLPIFKIKAGEQLWALQIEGKYCEAANNTILYVVTATFSVQNHSSVEQLMFMFKNIASIKWSFALLNIENNKNGIKMDEIIC